MDSGGRSSAGGLVGRERWAPRASVGVSAGSGLIGRARARWRCALNARARCQLAQSWPTSCWASAPGPRAAPLAPRLGPVAAAAAAAAAAARPRGDGSGVSAARSQRPSASPAPLEASAQRRRRASATASHESRTDEGDPQPSRVSHDKGLLVGATPNRRSAAASPP